MTSRDASWLLDDLVRRASGVQRAALLSSDGLLIGRSSALTRADAEHLAAAASALQSLGRGTGQHFDAGRVHQIVVEMERGFLLVTAAGAGASLAVLVDADADLGLVAFEVNRMVRRVGGHLSAAPRTSEPSEPEAS